MDIVIVCQYLSDIEDFSSNNNRFVYLAKLLSTTNRIEIVTSDFNHAKKTWFGPVDLLHGVSITTLHEPGYPKNISLKRLYSHNILAKNIFSYLSKREKPDVCYCAVPSLDVADSVARYCRNNDVRFIVDVQDLWPEAFKMVFRVPVISDLIFFPMKRKADSIYRSADGIVAVSQIYGKRALRVNQKCKNPVTVYLGTEKDTFDLYGSYPSPKPTGVTVGYIGSMEASYDLMTVIDAISAIKNHSIRLLAMGDGSLKESLAEYANEKGICAEFTGRLPYSQMVERLTSCDIAVNPIRKGSAASIINKVGDYAMAGLPVVNSQESLEYRNLIDEYHMGLNCNNEDSVDMKEKLERLVLDEQLRFEMGRNARKCAEEKFDRKISYKKIIELIESNKG